MISRIAITSFTFATAVQILIVDQSQLDVCNVLNTRAALFKLVSVLFNSESLSGNTQATREAMSQPAVWARINSLESNPSTGSAKFLKQVKSMRNCDAIDTIIELAMTIGVSYTSGELNKDELAITIADLVNEHVKTLDLSALPISADQLYEQYHQRALNTPLLTILPSCEKPGFQWTDAANYDWRSSVMTYGQKLYDDMTARLSHCDNCATHFVETLGNSAGVEISPAMIDKILAGFKQRVDDAIAQFASEDLPNTLGDLIAYIINKQRAKSEIATKPGQADGAVERIVTILDALNAEIVDGSGPMTVAFKDLYTGMGC